jgi:hypothetical protein
VTEEADFELYVYEPEELALQLLGDPVRLLLLLRDLANLLEAAIELTEDQLLAEGDVGARLRERAASVTLDKSGDEPVLRAGF